MLSKQPYKGTRDFFPAEKRLQDYLFLKMRTVAESFGHEAYDGPLLEEVELYKAKSGEELINDQIYDFTDRGQRHIAIRPEMTPTLARMVSQIHREAIKPLRWYSIPNLYRYEKPQKGRLREHWQFNCDIFGAPGRMGEIEILQVAISLMQSFGANSSQFEVLVNDRTIIEAVLKKILKANDETAYKIIKLIDRAKKIPKEALIEKYKEIHNSSSTSDFLEYLELKNFEELDLFLTKHELKEISLGLKELTTPLKDLDLLEYIKYDPTIARGLDYYTGIVFEIFDKHPDNRRAICGGGAYANLLQIFNEPALPGVGFGLGDVTLTDFLKTHELLPANITKAKNDLILATDDENRITAMMKLAQTLRGHGPKVITQLSPVKFNKVFALAEKMGATHVGLYGEQEASAGIIQIKNLENRNQTEVKIDNISAIIELIKKSSDETTAWKK